MHGHVIKSNGSVLVLLMHECDSGKNTYFLIFKIGLQTNFFRFHFVT